MFILSDKLYNGAKKLVQVILPAVGALYFSLSDIWDLPRALEVVGTISCITTFLGVCLGISNKTYQALGGGDVGTLLIEEDEDGKKTYSLDLSTVPEFIDTKTEVVFKVDNRTS